MKQFHVIAGCNHVKESGFVSPEDSQIIAVQHFEVNGHWITSNAATLANDGAFLTLTLEVPEGDYPYLDTARDTITLLREGITESDWLEGTTDEMLILPVSRIEFVDLNVLQPA